MVGRVLLILLVMALVGALFIWWSGQGEWPAAPAGEAQELAERMRREPGVEVEEGPEGVTLTLRDVLFDFDRAEVRPPGRRALEPVVAFLQEHPDQRLRIEGHADALGPTAYNTWLSHERAKAVAEYLAEEGVEPERMMLRAFGESDPVAPNTTEEGRQRNRRVELTLLGDRQEVAGGTGASSTRSASTP